jgi:hypothetical protein
VREKVDFAHGCLAVKFTINVPACQLRRSGRFPDEAIGSGPVRIRLIF